jgi:fucose permease
MGLTFNKLGTMVTPVIGAYDLNIKLQLSETLKQKLSSYLGLLQTFQVATNTYSIKLAGNGFFGPPQITKGQ